jgi:hypothetical protein
MRVEERGNEFEVWLSDRYDCDATLDLAELVALRAAVDSALMDYLTRKISQLVSCVL